MNGALTRSYDNARSGVNPLEIALIPSMQRKEGDYALRWNRI